MKTDKHKRCWIGLEHYTLVFCIDADVFNCLFVVAKFTVTIPKANAGEYFHDLDMLAKLLAPSGDTTAKQATIEVLGLY